MQRACFATRLLAASISLQLALGPQAFAQSAPQPNDARTSSANSANGTPVVNIAAPNAAGVSHNRYDTYDVGPQGLILNNSASDAVSLLGGGTAGNPNLAPHQAANLILNEVVTANPGSMLRGYQEILGPAAELVIANPWGVTCDGCGFINTPRVTLTTGVPTLSPSGALAGFTITGGLLAVTGQGLDASRQRALDLLARGLSIDGNVIVGGSDLSGDLQLLGGAHQFDYATRTGTAIAGQGPVLPFAIDSSVLGGMYADRIRLLVTEEGAGVRTAGQLAAFADDLTIDARGRIELRGAASAGRDMVVSGSDIQTTLADSETYLYAGRDLELAASEEIELGTGSLGAARNVDLSAARLLDEGGANDARFGGETGVLTTSIEDLLNIGGGYWTAPELHLSGGAVEIGSGAILFSDGTLSIAAQGDASSANGTLLNAGVLAGDLVTIEAGETTNLNGAIQAQTTLALHSATLNNEGPDALIVASGDAAGSATLDVAHINNSGVIWSGGDLILNPLTLQQQRAAGAETNPLIGAARDLTIAFADLADLGTGDLQAGRDLSITGAAVSDAGAIGAADTAPDLRYAGRNLSVTAADGGNVDIGGGQWYAEGDLRLTGDEVYLGSRIDETGTRVETSGVQLVGGWSGEGTLAAHARTGAVHFDSDAGAFSGANLAIEQQAAFALRQPNVLQANGTLSIAADGLIDNSGVIAGDAVSLASNSATDLRYVNRSTGALIGGSTIQIGSAARSAREITIENAAPDADAGIFGGGLDFHTDELNNYGLIQSIGPSAIFADDFYNDATGRLLGFSNADGEGGTRILGSSIWNVGMLYDSSLLSLDANRITNGRTGGIGSANTVRISTTGVGGTADLFDNLGEIWGGIVELDLPDGMINGRDPGVIENRVFPASIYADFNLVMNIGENAGLTNYGSIESAGDMQINNTGAGGGYLRNEMSMVSDAELSWVGGGSPYQDPNHNLGLLATNPYGDTSDRDEVTIDGVTYYVFDETDGGSFAYRDNRTTYLNAQQLSVPASSIPRPNIRAQGNLLIDGFDTVANTGATLGADGNLTIASSNPGSSVSNGSLQMQYRDEIREGVARFRCETFADDPVNCHVLPDHVRSLAPGPSGTRYANYRPGAVAFVGQIYAGGTLTIDVAGTVTNSSAPGPFAGIGNPGPTQIGFVGVAQPGARGARGDIAALLLNGANISLPTTANGRFVQGQDAGSGPLIESNPLFGLDSPYLGSEYLTQLLGLDPDEQTRRLGDDNYEAYLIQQQVRSASGRGVLESYYSAGDMVQALFENAAEESGRLDLGFGKALTQQQIASLQSDIVWMVEQEVEGKKVLVPVVYLADATRASFGRHSSIEGYNVDISAETVRNVGAEITANNLLNVETAGNIENLSGRMAGWNVRLDAGGDIVNSTLVKRLGDAENGVDRAQRTAMIEAGNTAVLTAGRDINVQGAWVAAGKDAALIAERNVNIESLVLTQNRHSGDEDNSYTQQIQTAHGAGVVAGGKIGIQGGEDVNLTGADVAAGETVALRAERGDVNIGVRELVNSSTSVTTRTGRYDQLERDVENGQLGIGVGTETKKTTRTTTTTTGIGSHISGSGVSVSTGAGDVNMIGSDIAAGEDGLIIDSAGDVNILAYENKSETTTTVDAKRSGVRIDGSYDGVFVGAQESGEKTEETTTQTTARTSGLSSGGDIVIRGEGDITNQGTRFDAGGDIALIGDDIINKAAQDTYTSTSSTEEWDSKQQVGFTANGTGSSIANVAQGKSQQIAVNNGEAQMRVTGSYNDETQTDTATRARTTQLNAGGNIIIAARGDASDEGTQYAAGKDILISAESYENKAAADTSSSSSEQTRASGQITAGLTTAAEVALTASGEGGHTVADNAESTAVTGSMKAGGAVVIQARSGDATFEGTQIDGQQGVAISAARDINLKQANDTRTASGSGESGSARLSGSVSVVGAGGSVGAGASGRTYENAENESTARTVSIRSGDGNVQLDAGRDIQSQGTEIAAGGDVALNAARDINLAAATDTLTKTGRADGGGVDANVGFGTGAAKGNGGGGATVDFERSRTDYSETTERGSEISAGGNFSLNAGRDAHLEGTQVDAQSAALNTGGNLVMESAQNTIKDDSYSVTGRIEASASKGGGAGGANTVGQGSSGMRKGGGGNAGGGNAGVDVTRSYQDIETNTNASINTRGATTLNVGGDMTMAGANIAADGGVSGTIAGDLNIESRVDKEIVDQTDVNAYAGIGAVGGMGGGNKFDRGQEKAQVAANQVGQTGVFTDVNTQTKDNRTIGVKSGISGGNGGIDLQVGGDTTLTGAANQGSDFDTQGRTTQSDIETRIDESSTDFRIAGTVASAAGSDQGKGGDYGLALNVPGSSTNAGRRRPNVPDNDAPSSTRPRPIDGPNTGPNTRPNAAPDTGPANRPSTRPNAQAGNDRPPPLPPRPNARAGNDGGPPPLPPRPVRQAQGGELPAAPTLPDRNVRPTPQDNGYNTRIPAPDSMPGENAALQPQRPANDDSYQTDDRPLPRPVGDEDAYIGESAPQQRPVDDDLYQTDDRPLPRPIGDQDAYIGESAPQQRPVRDDDLYQTDNQPAPAQSNEADNRVAMVRPSDSNARRGAVEPLPSMQDQVRLRIEADPALRELRQRGSWMDENEGAAFARNLAEIDAFIRYTGDTQQSAALIGRLETSLRGPQPREDGLTLFPLRPQYVGESVPGFDNWSSRPRRDKVGAYYEHPDRYLDPQPIRYLTPEQRAQARVVVQRDGTLGFTGNRPMENGKWIFVVDADGNMIAERLVTGHVHHSSLSGGNPVLMAGEFVVLNGKIQRVTNQSGHFRPDGQAFRRFLGDLRRSGADLSEATAPELSFETDERGRFKINTINENLLQDPSTRRNDAGAMLKPPNISAPRAGRTGWNTQQSEWLLLAA